MTWEAQHRGKLQVLPNTFPNLVENEGLMPAYVAVPKQTGRLGYYYAVMRHKNGSAPKEVYKYKFQKDAEEVAAVLNRLSQREL
ncbi:hypothetical protein [Streptomyces sp. NBC_01500]|uniref:hypothetical protein n=1 Tax=Streptomyces sp. NBC_01500 TaxID=2903886 RepID=UPI0022598913|nr:hypothetical protein [Streptomyces sp. NBC_01500]MCX4554146.1 hypothetical protein [Streptomyces sp. NBC_01500]